MTKRALSAVAGFLSFCLPLSAQQTDRPDIVSALNSSRLRFPSLTLADGGSFAFASVFNRMESTQPDFLPAVNMSNTGARSRLPASVWANEDSSKEFVEVRRNLFDNVHGEVGFLYGSSSGKFGRELEAGYVLGTIGDDKFSITAGASYEHSSGRVPRFVR